MTNTETLDDAAVLLNAIATAPDAPKIVQRACLIALEKIDFVCGHIRRADIQERMNSLKKKPATVTPIQKASG